MLQAWSIQVDQSILCKWVWYRTEREIKNLVVEIPTQNVSLEKQMIVAGGEPGYRYPNQSEMSYDMFWPMGSQEW